MNPTDDFESKLNQNDNNNSQTHPSQATFNPTDDPSTNSDHAYDHDLSQATFDIHPTDDPITDSKSAHNHNDVSPLDANTIQMLDKLKQCMIVLQPNNAETVLITSKLNELEAYFKREAYEYDDIVSDLNEKHDQSLIYAFCEDTLGDITIFHTLDACTSISVPTVSVNEICATDISAASNEEHVDMSSAQRRLERETDEYMQQFSEGEMHSLQAILIETNANKQGIDMDIEENEFDALLDETLASSTTHTDSGARSTDTDDQEEEDDASSQSDAGTGTDTHSEAYTEDEDMVVYSGYVWKESVFKNKFNQLWAHITGDKLYIFKDQNETEPIRMYDLKFYDDVHVISHSNDDGDHCDFQLISTQTSAKQVFGVDTAEEMNEWIQCIKQCQSMSEPTQTDDTVNDDSDEGDTEDGDAEDMLVHSGYLWKESVFKNIFNQHWAHLMQQKLSLFKNQNDAEPMRMYDLKLYNDVNAISESNDCDFQLISTQTSSKQMFRANTAHEMNEWIQYIRQCQPIPEPVDNKIDVANQVKESKPQKVESPAMITPNDTAIEPADDNKNHDENESTNRIIEMRSVFVSGRERHHRNGLETTKDIKQEMYEDPDADDDTDDDVRPQLNAEPESNPSSIVIHLDDAHRMKDVKDTKQPLDVQNEQLNPQLDVNTRKQRRNWRRSSMNTNVEQTIYEDPDVDETEQKVTIESQTEDTKETKQKREYKLYDEECTTQLHDLNHKEPVHESYVFGVFHKVKQAMIGRQSTEAEKALIISKLNQLEAYFKREAYEYDDIVSDLNEKHTQSLIYEFCKQILCDVTIFHTFHALVAGNDDTHTDAKEDGTDDDMSSEQRSLERETEEHLKRFSHEELHAFEALLTHTDATQQSIATSEFDTLMDEALSHTEQSRNWRRSLMNSNIEQTVYEDPDLDEPEATEQDSKTPTKENEEEPSIDDKYDEEYTIQFRMKWQNVIHAIKQELYKKIGKRINKIVENKENEIDQNDLSEDTVNKVLNILSDTKHSVSKEEYVYIKQLIERAAQFKPYMTGFAAQQTQITPRRFAYRYDFDKKGLLFCLGTNGTAKASDYRNPAQRKLVDVFSSPLIDGNVRALVGRRDEECTTRSRCGSFMAVYLKKVKIRLTYYTLRYYSWDCGAPRNWNLEGSNDNRSWNIIKQHVNDALLKKRGDTCTWKVTCAEYYSYLRMRSTGSNASVQTNCSLSLSGMELYGDAYGGSVIINSEVHPRYPMLTVSMLQDIYDVHRSFRYRSYHFEDYKWEHYSKEVMNEMYLELPNSYRSFKFNPSYVVNDDLFCVFQYIFGVSLYINQIMDSMTTKDEIKLFVIGHSVQCVYDDKIVFPYSIGNVEVYLRARNLHCGQYTVNDPTDLDDVSNIASFIKKARIELNADRDNAHPQTMNVLIIVDRRKDKDVIYVAEYKRLYRLNALHCNYFVGITFDILYGIDVSAYLMYGIHERLRFFPEQLTSIVPRLFKGSSHLNPHQYVSALYSLFYKQGFCLNLNTNINFNTYYKRITTITHVSVNYNRKYVAIMNLDDESTDDSVSKAKEMDEALEYACGLNGKLELTECIFITHIIKSLTRFRACNYRIRKQNSDDFDLNFLSKCYDHIITIHSFCFNPHERTKIQNFICDMIGMCPMRYGCVVLQSHASRTRETRRGPTRDTSRNHKERRIAKHSAQIARTEILQATMNSLHSYLVHTDAELFRLRDEEIDPGLRFSTTKDGLNEDDESKRSHQIERDSLNRFLRNNDITDRALNAFNDWCKLNEYDSDALNEDILYTHDSYLYVYFQANKIGIFFDLMVAKYVEDDSEVSQKEFNSLNFGIP
eukprot:752971_1